MQDHTLQRERKHFCCDSLETFNAKEILTHYVQYCFKIIGKQINQMSKIIEYVKFKNRDKKIKLSLMIHESFESILVLKDNGKENAKES